MTSNNVAQYCKEALRKFFVRFTEVFEPWLPEDTVQEGEQFDVTLK